MLLSVIVPTRNRWRCLADLLDSLARQEPVSFQWEVVVVDNASTDDTEGVVEQKSHVLAIPIRYVREARLGLHQGRHRGAREARGEYVGYLDDDMVLAPTWVQGVRWLAQGAAEAVVGRILPKWKTEPPSWLLAMVRGGTNGYLGLLDMGKEAKPIDPGLAFGGNCFLPRRLVFDLGGFHPDGMPAELLRYRGDGETALMAAFRRAGFRGYYDPLATAYHVIDAYRLTVESLCQKAYRQGISDSFTSIRAASVGEGIYPGSSSGPRAYVRVALRVVRRAVAGLWAGRDYTQVRKQMEEAYRSGWRFHQEAVAGDPLLLRYVMQKDYLGEETQNRG